LNGKAKPRDCDHADCRPSGKVVRYHPSRHNLPFSRKSNFHLFPPLLKKSPALRSRRDEKTLPKFNKKPKKSQGVFTHFGSENAGKIFDRLYHSRRCPGGGWPGVRAKRFSQLAKRLLCGLFALRSFRSVGRVRCPFPAKRFSQFAKRLLMRSFRVSRTGNASLVSIRSLRNVPFFYFFFVFLQEPDFRNLLWHKQLDPFFVFLLFFRPALV